MTNISIIGCGVMGSGLARALSKHHQITLYSKMQKKAEELGKEIGANVCHDLADAIADSEIIVLAVKPQDLGRSAKQLFGKIRDEQVLVSILSGINLEILKVHFGDTKVLRMMPNVPAFYGEGVIGLVESEDFNKKEMAQFTEIFTPLGKVIWVPENKINALTALSGSGPAFAFLIIESMVDAGILLGMTAVESKEIALQMFTGAITTLRETGKHPGELKWEVTSPGGCTIAGVKTMEDEAVRSGLINTFLSTYDRLQNFED